MNLSDIQKVDYILDAIRLVVGQKEVPLHEPSFTSNEKNYLDKCIDSTFVSTVGPFVSMFESELAKFVGVKHAISTVNGTAALHLSLLASGISRGEEVLTPALSFVATANAISYTGAIPHFVDSDFATLGIAVEPLREYLKSTTTMKDGQCINLKTGRKISALIPMHTLGHPVDIEGILKIAYDFNLIVIEDAAESLGSYYQGSHTGTFGYAGIFSFNGNKIITTGGGGAVVTNSDELAKKIRHLSTTSKKSHPWEFIHDEIGYNYRMPNINAALGCAQLEKLPKIIKSKRNLYSAYCNSFSDLKFINIYAEPKKSLSNYWLQALVLNNESKILKETILEKTNKAGISTRPIWKLLSDLLPYKNCPKSSLVNSKDIENRLICIPSSTYSE